MLQKFGLEEAPIDESDYLSGSAKSGYGGISVSFPNENDDVSSIGTNFDGANYKVRDDPEKDNHKGKSISIDAAVGKFVVKSQNVHHLSKDRTH